MYICTVKCKVLHTLLKYHFKQHYLLFLFVHLSVYLCICLPVCQSILVCHNLISLILTALSSILSLSSFDSLLLVHFSRTVSTLIFPPAWLYTALLFLFIPLPTFSASTSTLVIPASGTLLLSPCSLLFL